MATGVVLPAETSYTRLVLITYLLFVQLCMYAPYRVTNGWYSLLAYLMFFLYYF